MQHYLSSCCTFAASFYRSDFFAYLDATKNMLGLMVHIRDFVTE
jgi:hypothetical protein